MGVWVEEFARRAGLSMEVQNAVDLSLVEWVANVTAHAHRDSSEHWITLRFEATDAEARVEIEDDGEEFNPLTHPPADTSAPLEIRPVGGLGIHLIPGRTDRWYSHARASSRRICPQASASTRRASAGA